MTEPKVSERMADLVRGYGQNAVAYGGRGSQHDKASLHICREQLLSAIAEIEQRAGEIDFFASIVREHYADIVMPTVEDRDAAKPSDWINCAIMELGNQHKRAEKWKETAVAESRLRQLKFCSAAVAAEAAKRVGLAIAALGDEWDEAVKGEG